MLVELGAVPTGETVATVLAQNPEPPPDKGDEFGKASPVALVVILCLAVATILLIVSMSRRIRRLPRSFDEQTDTDAAEPASEENGTSAGERPERRS